MFNLNHRSHIEKFLARLTKVIPSDLPIVVPTEHVFDESCEDEAQHHTTPPYTTFSQQLQDH